MLTNKQHVFDSRQIISISGRSFDLVRFDTDLTCSCNQLTANAALVRTLSIIRAQSKTDQVLVQGTVWRYYHLQSTLVSTDYFNGHNEESL